MKLSILICTIKGREKLLNHLLDILEKQMSVQVEVLNEKDNKEISIGAKRNKLLERAKGDYICFIDDDDEVPIDYIPKVLQALKTKPDCCSLMGELVKRGCSYKFMHSIKYDSWFEKKGVYYRCPNHLNTVRRDLAVQVGFPDINIGEDKIYSLSLLPLLKTEIFIEGTIYYYRKDY